MTKPPTHLSAEMKAFWKDLASRFELDGEHLQTLRLACEQYDRAQACREQILADGLVTKGGQRHPLLGAEAKAVELFYRGLRELGLDDSDPPAASASELGRKAAMARWHG